MMAVNTLDQRLADWCLPSTTPPCHLAPLDTAHPQLWDEILARLPDQPAGYARLHCDYQHAYFSESFPLYRRLDRIVFWGRQPVGIWPLAVFGDDEGLRLSSHINGAPGVAPPLPISCLSDKQEKTVARAWLTAVASLCRDLAIPSVLLTPTQPQQNLPYWHRLAMTLGARVDGRHHIAVDLCLSKDSYHRHLRKSYKALINTAKRLWRIEIDTHGKREFFTEFQDLHARVAGRRTRSDLTWDLQFSAIAAGKAFAVYLRNECATLVGASLFNTSRDEAHYAVGAYDRELFDQPLAHLSLDCAIVHARASGMKRLALGQRPYPGDSPPPTDKELQIAFFKEGFATDFDLLPRLCADTASLARILDHHQG